MRFKQKAIYLTICLGLLADASPALAQFTIRSIAEEKQQSAEEHPKILAQFGGPYTDQKTAAYFAAIAGRLAANSENPQVGYTFTLLNSPVLNAFALPGGYVYITRMIMALANDEAEVAGVIGHEIGHVTARHGSQRETQNILGGLFGLGAAVLGSTMGIPGLGEVAQFGAQAYLSKYSRDQEFEADMLGVTVLSRTGYDPYAMADFLASLGAFTDMEGRRLGQKRNFNLFDTHPNTPDRVARAVREAGHSASGNTLARNEENYLRQIDGMLYGDDPKEGLVRGKVFSHAELRIAFQVPDNFNLNNQSDAVIATGPNGATIQFDLEPDQSKANSDPATYITRYWTKDGQTRQLSKLTVGGLPAAIGLRRVQTQAGSQIDAQLVAIQGGAGKMYRFVFLTTPNTTARFTEAFKRTLASFHGLNEQELASLKPYRIHVVRAGANDSEQSLASRMPNDGYQLEHFRVLNGITAKDPFKSGRSYKIVGE